MVGLQNNDDGTKTAFHWGDNGSYKAFMAMKLDEKNNVTSGAVCLTNSNAGTQLFRESIEPVVSDLS